MANIAATSPALSITPATSSTTSSPSGLGAVVAAVSVVESLQAQAGAKFAEVMGPNGAGDGMTAANLVALQTLGAQLDTTALGLTSTAAVYRDSEKVVANKF
jgi:hypothetical protein